MPTLSFKANLTLFTKGFLQVLFISMNTTLIAFGVVWALPLISFAISWNWSANVKKMAVHNLLERISYCLGAGIASPVGYLLVHAFHH